MAVGLDLFEEIALVLQSGCAIAEGNVTNVVGFFKLAGFLGRVFVNCAAKID
jgi:hypothetical protein